MGPPCASYARLVLAVCGLLLGGRGSLEGAAGPLLTVLGSPLSASEYGTFFAALRPGHRAALVCWKRLRGGCDGEAVAQLDALENHGLVPRGPVCSDIPGSTRFSDFCEFAVYRCTTVNYYAKRVPCRKEAEGEPGRPERPRRRVAGRRRIPRSDYEGEPPAWSLPRAAGGPPAPSELEATQRELQEVLGRLRDPRASQAAERLREAVDRGDAEAVQRESERLVEALKEAGRG